MILDALLGPGIRVVLDDERVGRERLGSAVAFGRDLDVQLGLDPAAQVGAVPGPQISPA